MGSEGVPLAVGSGGFIHSFRWYDEYDETRADSSRWKGIYETWRRRKESYREQLQERDLTETLRVPPAY